MNKRYHLLYRVYTGGGAYRLERYTTLSSNLSSAKEEVAMRLHEEGIRKIRYEGQVKK